MPKVPELKKILLFQLQLRILKNKYKVEIWDLFVFAMINNDY